MKKPSIAPNIPSVLVTGAGTGIGLATSELFLNHGWHVIAVGRRPEPLTSLAASFPNRVLAAPCDISKLSDVEELIREIRSHPAFAENLRVIVNNAGLYERASIEESDDDLWMRIYQTNLMGAVRLTRGLLPELKAEGGTIVNVASNLGLNPISMTSVYSSLKAALIAWTRSLALELGSHQIRANCVCPGIVDTPIQAFHQRPEIEKKSLVESLGRLQPLGRIGQPKDIAHAIYSLSGPGSEWTTGAVLTVDGGISLGKD